ncbi:hypothetical protein F4X10_14125 [Candidatus Poribacteria bacterium]|nr:hypothetical protein [Candidatus Poribacteria bacterium]
MQTVKFLNTAAYPQGIIKILLLCCFLPACGGLKLVDISKSSTALKLTTAQQQTIHPKLKLIRDIVEDYDFEKKQLEVDYQIFRAGMTQRYYDRYESGFMDARSRRELNAFRDEARKFLKQREIYLDEIKDIVEEVVAELTPEQRVKLTELKLPKLEVPVMLQRDPYNDLRYIPSHPLGGVNIF